MSHLVRVCDEVAPDGCLHMYSADQANTMTFPYDMLACESTCPLSTERTGNIVLRMLFARVLEDFFRRTVFHQVSRTAALRPIDVQEGRVVGDALGLLQVMGHDGDGVLLF